MSTCQELLQQLTTGTRDELLARLYGDVPAARERIARLLEAFDAAFPGHTDAALFSGPGRTELGGNHTDHQHGHVLCASVDLDILCCAAPNGSDTIRFHSAGYPPLTMDLEDLSPRSAERGTTAALLRGVCDGVRRQGYPLRGFDACAVSTVLPGPRQPRCPRPRHPPCRR